MGTLTVTIEIPGVDSSYEPEEVASNLLDGSSNDEYLAYAYGAAGPLAIVSAEWVS